MTKLLGTCTILLIATSNILQAQSNSLLVSKNNKDSLHRFTDSIRNLPPLEVRSVRVSNQQPFAKSNVSAAQIAQVNVGQDLPFLIQNTPSVVVHSDAGTGVGYTGIRIRGTDATRINVTLNGIPYNDAESMATYFVDLPDFSSSVNSIQIQRGVGTSTNGAGSFGATLNLATNDYKPQSYLSFQNSYGSFNTLKNTLQLGSGLLKDKFTLDARLSNIGSDGYIDRAKSDLKSFYVSSTYWGDQSSLRLNIFSGKEKTYQAWYGVPEELLASKRTFNPAGTEKSGDPYDNQTDNYTQTHYQLFYNKKWSPYWSFNTALFLTRGKGYYEEYKASVLVSEYQLPSNPAWNSIAPDLIRQRWLDNHFWGQIASVEYEKDKNKITIGGGWNQYDGDHFGELPYPNLIPITTSKVYYKNNALKKEVNLYAKWQYQINNNWNSFLDIQYRNVSHNMYGFDHTPDLTIQRNFDFINPKAGITYTKGKTTYYSSFALAHKEPNRDDFEAGLTQQPKQEILYDWETGFTKKDKLFEYGANIYVMNYKDQLVLTGKINDIGAYTRTNVPKSSRIGIEIEASHKLNSHLTSSGNITLSQNKIESFTEYIDDYDNGGQIKIQHNNKDITLSPATTASHVFTYTPDTKWQFHFTTKYVSKQYLDNTQNENRILKAYWTQDISAQWKCLQRQKWNAILQVHALNIFDHLYEPNGYTYSYYYGGVTTTSNNYYPMAGRNFWISLKIDLK
jgi:iron complex outermembrane receptor protein